MHLDSKLIFQEHLDNIVVVIHRATWHTFQPKLEKKNPPRKNFYIPGKMELSNPNIKNFFIFSQKKAVLIFHETETPEKFLIFSQEKAFLIFQEVTFRA